MVLLVKEHADEFPRQQSYYQAVLDLLDKMLQLIRSYITRGRDGRQLVPRYLLDVVDITRGRDGRQLVPRYLLDAAGDLVDIISGDHSNVSAADVVDRRTTIERAVQMIDQVMIVIFQVSASSVGRIARAL